MTIIDFKPMGLDVIYAPLHKETLGVARDAKNNHYLFLSNDKRTSFFVHPVSQRFFDAWKIEFSA